MREMRQHRKDWETRYEIYQTIHYDMSHIKRNLDRVLNGDSPEKLQKPQFAPLILPKNR